MSSKEDFIASIAPKAQEIQRKYGVPASIAIAQAALESGWGKSAKGNNLFGIKASGNWQGDKIAIATHEYINGARIGMTDAFRSYGSTENSIENYGQFLAGNKRYAGVIGASGEDAADALQRAGYATDPKYAAALKAIIRDNDLTRFDDPQYRNYAADEGRFEETRRKLNTERMRDPKSWDDFVDGFLKLLVSAAISYATQPANVTAPQTPAPAAPAKMAALPANPRAPQRA